MWASYLAKDDRLVKWVQPVTASTTWNCTTLIESINDVTGYLVSDHIVCVVTDEELCGWAVLLSAVLETVDKELQVETSCNWDFISSHDSLRNLILVDLLSVAICLLLKYPLTSGEAYNNRQHIILISHATYVRVGPHHASMKVTCESTQGTAVIL